MPQNYRHESLHCAKNDTVTKFLVSKIIFSEKSLSVHMSVCPSVPSPSPSRPPKKLLKLKTLISKVVRYTLRDATTTAAAAAAAAALLGNAKPSHVYTTQFRVGPKQFCALAHLGCTHAAGTS